MVHLGKQDLSTEMHNFCSSGFDNKCIISVLQFSLHFSLSLGHVTSYFPSQFKYKQKASNCFSNFKYASVNVEGFFRVGEHF